MIATLEIDVAALRANVRALAALVAPARFAAVVKANAYGHGLVPVARAIEDLVDHLCVYRVEEALALRTAGIETAVLILGPVERRDLELAYESRTAIGLWDDGVFRREVAGVARRGGRPFSVHAKVDTGTTRLGFGTREAPAAIASLLGEPELRLVGAYTHLAAVEEREDAFTAAQLDRFEDVTAPFAAEFRERGVVRHAAASAAAMLVPRARYDLVRAGIAIYGIWPSEATQRAAGDRIALQPVLTWRTELAAVRDVDAGTSVGYGCTFETTRRSRIGVLPIGYSEGLPRSASNAGVVLVAGRRVPIVGRVCMNMTFVDLTDVPGTPAVGDRVTLIGRDGDERIDANEVGERCGTIGYEIVARLPAAITRGVVSTTGSHRDATPTRRPLSVVP